MIDASLRDELHGQLLSERDRLRREIDNLRDGIRGATFLEDEQDSVDQHPADAGSELFEREKNLNVQRTLELSLQQVEDALRRYDEGTYGICETCGNPIAEKRLRAYPAATHCIDCQSTLERRH
jgi:DnaK suppressor protein